MGVCELCGNDYDKTFSITTPDGMNHVFDSFECAVHQIAPRCDHCGCKIIGHGVEAGGHFFCCAHCAKQSGYEDLKDRANA